MSLHDGVCSPFNPVGAPSVIITTERYEGVLPLRLRACWIFIVLIPRRFLFILLLQIMLNVSSTLLLWGSREQYAEKPCYYTYCTHPTCTNMLSLQQVKGKRMRETERNWPSPGMIRSVTVFPASLIRLTISEWDLLVMEQLFTARIRSPTFSFPQRSAGLPSMMRPILWGIATHAFPAFGQQWLSMYEF